MSQLKFWRKHHVWPAPKKSVEEIGMLECWNCFSNLSQIFTNITTTHHDSPDDFPDDSHSKTAFLKVHLFQFLNATKADGGDGFLKLLGKIFFFPRAWPVERF